MYVFIWDGFATESLTLALFVIQKIEQLNHGTNYMGKNI